MTQKLPSVLKGAQIASHRIYSTWNGIGNLYKNIMMDLVHKGPPQLWTMFVIIQIQAYVIKWGWNINGRFFYSIFVYIGCWTLPETYVHGIFLRFSTTILFHLSGVGDGATGCLK